MGFTDLLSSSRGPGVIGTLAALLVLVGFGTLYLFVFDEALQGGQKTIEAVIRDQGREIEALKTQIATGKQRGEDAKALKEVGRQADEMQARTGHDESRIAGLKTAKVEAEAAILAAHEAWENYKDEYRASEWAAADGEELGEMRTLGGEVLTNVIITGVDHTGVKVSHSGGLKTVPPEELPLELHDRFQFSKEKTDDVRGEMKKDFKHLADTVEITRLSDKARSHLATVQDLKLENRKLTIQIEKAKANLPRQQAAINQQQTNIAAERAKRGGISRAPAMQDQLRAMERALDRNRSSIPENEKKVSDNNRQIQTLEREVGELKGEMERLRKELAERAEAASQP